MGMDWPEMGFPTPFPAKFMLRIIIRKTYFGQKVGLHPLKIDINNTEKNRPDLPVPTVVLPSRSGSSRRGLWPKYFSEKIVKIVIFRKIRFLSVPGYHIPFYGLRNGLVKTQALLWYTQLACLETCADYRMCLPITSIQSLHKRC